MWRLGISALAFLGVALWFLIDGTITYPNQQKRAQEYQREYQRLEKDEGLSEEERLSKWKEIAKQRGWPEKKPDEPKTDAEIYVQLVIAALASVPGLLYAVAFLRARRRWIELEETGLRTSWGRQLEFGQIVSLNKKKWKTKGIAKITYRQNGRKRRVVLDDWKYDAEPTKAILCEVESHLDASQIVGGPPEPPPEPAAEDERPEDDPTPAE